MIEVTIFAAVFDLTVAMCGTVELRPRRSLLPLSTFILPQPAGLLAFFSIPTLTL